MLQQVLVRKKGFIYLFIYLVLTEKLSKQYSPNNLKLIIYSARVIQKTNSKTKKKKNQLPDNYRGKQYSTFTNANRNHNSVRLLAM